MTPSKELRNQAIDRLRTAIIELKFSDADLLRLSEARAAVNRIKEAMAYLEKADKAETAPVEIQTYYKTASEGLEAAIADAQARGYEIDEAQSYLDNALLFHSTKEEGQSIRLGFDLYIGSKTARGISRKALHIQLYKMRDCWELNHYIA
jgi:hypothetical protein